MNEAPTVQIVPIDLKIEPVTSAEIVLRAALPDQALRTDQFYSLGDVVRYLFRETWREIEPILIRHGFDVEHIHRIRDAVTLASWNQVCTDMGWTVRVTQKDPV